MKPMRMIGALCGASVLALALTTTPGPAAAAPKWCPPGLAKKGCIPPGQRKKYQVGQRLPDYVRYRTIYDYERYELAPPPQGHFYGYVDEDIVLIRAATRLVVDAVILGALLN
ncbi:MAG: RcnB family protein [Paracoccaceae bacterium]|nr:RcnB family protein [Paracoccaceae bacterium]